MIKGIKLLWAMSSILLLSACTPTEAVTEEEITASSSIESSVEFTSLATDKEESVCGKINLHTIAAQKYITPQAA